MEVVKIMIAVDLLNHIPVLEEAGQENYVKASTDTNTNYYHNNININ